MTFFLNENNNFLPNRLLDRLTFNHITRSQFRVDHQNLHPKRQTTRRLSTLRVGNLPTNIINTRVRPLFIINIRRRHYLPVFRIFTSTVPSNVPRATTRVTRVRTNISLTRPLKRIAPRTKQAIYRDRSGSNSSPSSTSG